MEPNVAFKRGLAWSAIGQAAFFLTQFIGSVVVARILSPFELGVYALALAIVGILNLVQAVGLGAYLVREVDLTQEKIVAAFTVNTAIALVLSAATALVAVLGSFLTNNADVGNVLLVLAIAPLINVFMVVPWSLLERDGDFKSQTYANTIKGVLATGVTVYMAWQGYSYYSIAWGQVAGAIASAVTLNVIARQHAVVGFSLSGWRSIARFSVQMVVISGVNSLASRASDFALGKSQGLAALGLYNRAGGIMALLWENLHAVFNRVVLVEMAQQKREGTSLRAIYLLISENVSAVLWPFFTGTAVLAYPLVNIVYGPKWVEAAPLMQLLALSGVIQLSVAVSWEVFVVSDAVGKQAKLESTKTIIGVILFVAASFYSLRLAATARVVETIISILLYRPHLERLTDTRLKDMWPIYARSGLLTLSAVFPSSLLVIQRGSKAVDIKFLELLGVVSLGGVLWFLTLAALKHPLFIQGVQLIRHSRARST